MNTGWARFPSRRLRGFTFAELMLSLIIFALVATAGGYLLASAQNAQKYAQGSATADSEVEYAKERITENIRGAAAVSDTGSSITITSGPSPLISGGTFTITYSPAASPAGTNLVETWVNNTNSQTYSTGILVHNVSQFAVAKLGVNPKAFQVTVSTGTATTVRRIFVAFGRNL